jgi:cell fate (sporulation/competence/biofilm development) regulator YmcA (YheA/YmcA/DUF963 family)
MNNPKVQEKLDELIELLNNQEEIPRFKEIEKQLKQNDYIQSRVNEYKRWQQKVVLVENKNQELPQETSDKLDRLYNELFEIPIYNEYSLLQEEINDVLQQISFILEEELNR